MSVPAPTPYKVSKYSTDSAGEAFGEPIIELLHGYYHHGSDDIQANQEYGMSLIGVFASIIALGLWFLFVLWCFNCCACCKCCRKLLACCFDVFHEKRTFGQMTLISIFLVAAIIATTSYAGGEEFNDAVFEIGDQMRYVADIFDDISTESNNVVQQAALFVNASSQLSCANTSATLSFQGTSSQMSSVGDSLEGLVDGISDKIRDRADYIEEEFPPWVDLAMLVSTCMIWLNVLLGSIAIMTKCKCDDCLVLIIGTLTILILTIAVAVELTLATFAADFCYAVPEDMILKETSNEIATFYLTCNGTSPFSSYFDDARDYVTDFRDDISKFGIGCATKPIQMIAQTANSTVETITRFERITGCGSINPLFTNTFHNIFCDEFVRGLFITLMIQAASAVLLFIALMVFPCAANTRVLFEDPKHMAKSIARAPSQTLLAVSSNKIAPEENSPASMEMVRNDDQMESQPIPPPMIVDATPVPSNPIVKGEAIPNTDPGSSIEDADIKNMMGQEF